MPKRDKEKEIRNLAIYLQLIQDGLGTEEAAKHTEYKRRHLDYLRKRYNCNTFEKLLSDNGFDPTNWNHAWLKVDGASIHIRNKDEIVTYDDVRDEMIREMKKHAPKYRTLKRTKKKDGHLLIVDIADMHIGKYATNGGYDLEIAKNRVEEGLEGIIHKAQGFDIDQILLVVGNDALHIDTPHRKTTSGTPQDTDKQWHEAFVLARQLYVHMVETLLPIADIHCVYNPSNHDYSSGYMLAENLYAWFHNAKNITFDVDTSHRKYYQYGESLIGTTHGDGAKEANLGKLMATEEKNLWAETTYRYFYCHHKHHKIAKDDIGVCIEYLRSPSSADRWHSDNGYINQPAVEGFIHSKTKGQIARLTHYC